MKRILTITIASLVAAAGANAEMVYGITDTQTLVRFNSSTPGTIDSGVAISGLQQNEQLLGIDFRPANGQLYALGSFSNLYTVDINTGNGCPFCTVELEVQI